ncbi:MAG: hypothetical protein CUN56_11655 [Phototrophicales bacterium]|nr:MAG: hypothetical protein CUN56_11655 [Phototrophicales bacterium]RMG70651.1 MAG: site-specific integrase [Chloroflexota bacterium]
MANHPLVSATPLPNFDAIIQFTLGTVASSSAETYQRTFDLWADFCMNHRLHPLDLRPHHVQDFLISQPVTKRTRQRHLAALRKLARTLALDPNYPQFRAVYEALRLMQTPEQNAGGKERERRVLNHHQVMRVLDVWQEDKLIHRRNRALLAVLFYTGLRRAEVRMLRWADLELDTGIIRVRHGKGDKFREVSIITGQEDTAVHALRAYQAALHAATNQNREFVFCSIRKGDKPGKDKPVNVRAINQIVEHTAQQCGVTFTPHDARRTLGTDLLAQSFPVPDVQAQLGHSHASTTIQNYAMPAQARQRRKRFKTSY